MYNSIQIRVLPQIRLAIADGQSTPAARVLMTDFLPKRRLLLPPLSLWHFHFMDVAHVADVGVPALDNFRLRRILSGADAALKVERLQMGPLDMPIATLSRCKYLSRFRTPGEVAGFTICRLSSLSAHAADGHRLGRSERQL